MLPPDGPPPDNWAIPRINPPRSSAAPATSARLSSLLGGSGMPSPARRRTPALILVPPEYVLSPLSVIVLAPFLISAAGPEILPERVKSAFPPMMVANPLSVMGPEYPPPAAPPSFHSAP